MRNKPIGKELTSEERYFLDKLISDTQARAHIIIKTKLGEIGKNSVEDCFQDVCYLMCLRIDTLKNHEKPELWVFKAACNMASNYLKGFIAEKSRKTVSLTDVEGYISDDTITLEEQLVEKILFDQYMKNSVIEKVLSTLSRRERNLYDMKYVQELSYRAIAGKLNTSENSVRAMLTCVRKKIFGNLSNFL